MLVQPKCGTQTGLLFDLLQPNSDEVRIADIAASLVRQVRFNGHTKFPYSVAQHSLFVADLMSPEFRAYGLVHDCHEAYMGDITSPVKSAIKELGGEEALETLDKRLAEAVHKAFGLQYPPPPEAQKAVHAADKLAAKFEKAHLLNLEFEQPFVLHHRLMKYMKPWSEEKLVFEFVKRLMDI